MVKMELFMIVTVLLLVVVVLCDWIGCMRDGSREDDSGYIPNKKDDDDNYILAVVMANMIIELVDAGVLEWNERLDTIGGILLEHFNMKGGESDVSEISVDEELSTFEEAMRERELDS